MSIEALPPELDELLRRYLWEYDPARLSWEENRHTIMTRLLESGGWDAVRWLRAHLSDDELREFLRRRRGRGLELRRLRFWGLVLDIPEREVDGWIEAARANPWFRRTHDRGG